MGNHYRPVFALIVLSVVAVAFDREVIEIADSKASLVNEVEDVLGVVSPARMLKTSRDAEETLGESNEDTTGLETMTAAEATMARTHFMNMVMNFKTNKMRGLSLIASRQAEEAFGEDNLGAKETGSGLKLIFDKLNELQEEILAEQDGEGAANAKWNQDCDDAIALSVDIVVEAQKESATMLADTRQMQVEIAEDRQDWTTSRNAEDSTHQALREVQNERDDAMTATSGMVNERNKAIDVMQTALFLICERMPKFRDGAICTAVKSQPDVKEPPRFATKSLLDAKADDEMFHSQAECTNNPKCFYDAWELKKQADLEKEGDLNPEGGPYYDPYAPATEGGADSIEAPGQRRFRDGDAMLGEPLKDQGFVEVDPRPKLMTGSKRQDGTGDFKVKKHKKTKIPKWPKYEALTKDPHLTLAQAIAMDENDSFDLGEDDKMVLGKVMKLSNTAGIPQNAQLVLAQLGSAIQEGAGARSKSIVEILMDVLSATRQELFAIKEEHLVQLNEFYVTAWGLVDEDFEKEWEEQKIDTTRIFAHRNSIIANNARMEVLRQNMEAAIFTKYTKENSCAMENEEYGIRESYRLTDLENIRKLKSLLRMLYFKKKPTTCPKNAQTKALCSGMDRGWCIFTDISSNTQECSCQPGFYGDACEHKMCPGVGRVLYRHDQMGQCSTTPLENRGQCNPVDGLCTCNDVVGESQRFYHGPKQSCDFMRPPPSRCPCPADSGMSEEECVDTSVNGCWAQGVDMVPSDVASVPRCSGHGRRIMNEETGITYEDGYDTVKGECHCVITGDHQYWGAGCEKKKCPHSNGQYYPSDSTGACEGRGGCNDRNGACTCNNPYYGEACENERCFRDCGPGGHQVCNVKTAQCACPTEYGTINFQKYGEACEFRECPENCGSAKSRGVCNRVNGQCLCRYGYSGHACWETTRCSASVQPNAITAEQNWWTVWDKPGWITCPKGQYLYSLKRSKCDALSCIDEGGCAAACEGTGKSGIVYTQRHCYHDLRWYNSFDKGPVEGDLTGLKNGWSKCLTDYYVSGLYRSGESLYELQMAKCCNVEYKAMDGYYKMRVMAPVRHIECGTNSVTEFAETAPGADGELTITESRAFITGFRRNKKHTLAGFSEVSWCRFVRGY
jgi:hypothetical protein